MNSPLDFLTDLWGERAPVFLVHLQSEHNSGSGIQIDAHHIVTCAHVLDPSGPDRFYRAPRDQRPDVTAYSPLVCFGRFETKGAVVAQHEFLDLALVRLAKPRPGIAAPLLFESEFRGEACVAGASGPAGDFELLLHPI